METHDEDTLRSRLFTVRVWSEHRGNVRDVRSGAFRSFRHWSDLVDFLAAPADEDRTSGGRHDLTIERPAPPAGEDER